MGEILSKEESIKLASDLADKYAELSIKEAEFMGIKAKLDNLPDHSGDPKYSAFKFFWPYLVIASVAEAVIFTIAFTCIMTFGSNLVVNLIFFGLILLIWPVIVIFGSRSARRKRDALNDGIAMKARNDQRLKLEYENELNKKEKELVRIEKELGEFNDIVPSTMRNRDYMETIKRTIETGEAENFFDAISRLKPAGQVGFS